MDELLRNRNLLKQLQENQENLRKSLSQLQTNTDAMTAAHEQLMMTNTRAGQEATDEGPGMEDLPDDVMFLVLSKLQEVTALCTVCQVCRRWSALVGEGLDALWRPLCRSHWGVWQEAAGEVPCIEGGLGVLEFYYDEVMDDMSDWYGEGDHSTWDGGAAGDGSWKAVYRDRLVGWRRGVSVLRWLHEHDHPAEVSGLRHRYELYTGIMYIGVCLDSPEGMESSVGTVKHLSGLKSLCALLDNESGMLVEQVCAALANIFHVDPGARQEVLNMNGQVALTALLPSNHSRVQREASRALIQLLAEQPVPLVAAGAGRCVLAVHSLQSGLYTIQEYSASGSGEAALGVSVELVLQESGAVIGFGSDEVDDFELHGTYDIHRTQLDFVKQYRGGMELHYTGHRDLHGVWGSVQPARSPNVFVISAQRPPRCFRMYCESVFGDVASTNVVGPSTAVIPPLDYDALCK